MDKIGVEDSRPKEEEKKEEEEEKEVKDVKKDDKGKGTNKVEKKGGDAKGKK